MKTISFIIPCYNETPAIVHKIIGDLQSVLNKLPDFLYEIILVNDCSTRYSYPEYENPAARLITHIRHRGYGSCIYSGITHAQYDWIGIVDADGTYPVEKFIEMIPYTDAFDMIIGQRSWRDIEVKKRLPKFILQKLASFLAKEDIPDLNSGMRLFKKHIVRKHKRVFPQGFSFTSTLTMICATHGHPIQYIPIAYLKRIGSSHISPVQDTIGFFALVLRLSLYFRPLRFFIPLSLFFGFLAVARGVRDVLSNNYFGGLTLVLFFIAFQIFFFGLIAEIINKK